jgi:bacteriocin-like protein
MNTFKTIDISALNTITGGVGVVGVNNVRGVVGVGVPSVGVGVGSVPVQKPVWGVSGVSRVGSSVVGV